MNKENCLVNGKVENDITIMIHRFDDRERGWSR